MAAEDGDSVSMVDVLEGGNALEEEAMAVLGGSDEKNCTYPLGYVDRQALYSCQTCQLNDDESAGVCLACSLHCHEGHTLVELYTKRNFCCDCGNGKFSDSKCKLSKEKDSCNKNNKYNHNFSGRYCTCNGIYPNPDDEVEDEMIQCIICEDWYHSRHLGTLSPVEFQEMTCDGCMDKLPFLTYYSNSDDYSATCKTAVTEEKQDTAIDVVTNTDDSVIECKLRTLKDTQDNKSGKATAAFWKSNWRQNLCPCSSCKDLYTSFEVEFLTKENDTVEYYEKKGEIKGSTYDNAMEALDGMERTQKIEVLHEFNVMKDELTDYLKTFAENGKVVKKEDIDEFFSQLSARKRPRLEIPQNCR